MEASTTAPAQSPSPNPNPASPATTPATASAVDQAVKGRDFGKFREAKRAAATSAGPAQASAPASEPVTPQSPAAADATPAAPAPTAPVSKRQQEINEHIRRATASEQENTRLRAEIARLQGGAAPGQRPDTRTPATATPTAPAQPATADPEPTLDQFDSYEKFVTAQSRWAARQEITAREQQAQTRATERQRADADRTRATRFSDSIQAEIQTDAQFLSKISPDVLALKPFSALEPGERGGPRNAIAEELLDSDVAPQLMRHFTEHPEEITRLERLPNARALVREFGRLEARFQRATPAAAQPPELKTVPAAPAPPQTLGTRPSDPPDAVAGAVKSRNFAAYREAKARQRAAGRT